MISDDGDGVKGWCRRAGQLGGAGRGWLMAGDL